jgi:hypothetical protein
MSKGSTGGRTPGEFNDSTGCYRTDMSTGSCSTGCTCPKTAQAAVGQKRLEAAYKTIPGTGQGLVLVCFGLFRFLSVSFGIIETPKLAVSK